jgi:hypothetical protein
MHAPQASHEPFLVLMRIQRSGVRVRGLIGLVALVWLGVQAVHPWMHPAESLDPHAGTHCACPLSHAAADLPRGVPALRLTPLVLAAAPDLRLWWGYRYFSHPLAPRPPPAFHPSHPQPLLDPMMWRVRRVAWVIREWRRAHGSGSTRELSN